MTEPIKVDIWSDVVCPWCYIGKRKFEAGSAAFSAAGEGRGVVVEYHSYELSPDAPVDFVGNSTEYFIQRKGVQAAQVGEMLERVTSVAASVGLDFDYDSLLHTNTVTAHQLLHHAKSQGKQLEMMERLFRALFTEGRHVGHVADLADLAAEVGLDRSEVVRVLEANEFLSDVRADQSLAMEYGIQGVPFFVIDGRYGVSGAQESAAFAQVLEQVWAERDAKAELAAEGELAAEAELEEASA